MIKLKKYKYILLTNIYTYFLFFSVQMVTKTFGIDDIYANRYIYCKSCTIIDNIHSTFDRMKFWNCRIGELIYFIVGWFPRWVYYILSSFNCIIFLNLVYIFIYGKNSKKYFFTKKYILTILFSFLITITLFPGYSEVFVWMGGNFNHLFDFNIILLCALPFRLLYDNIDILKNKKRKIIHFIISIITGFTIEHTIPTLLIYESSILIYKKEKSIKGIISIILTSVSFISFILLSVYRINFFKKLDHMTPSKLLILLKVFYTYRYLIFITFILLLILTKGKNLKEFIISSKLYIFQFILSIISLLIIKYSMAFYSVRVSFPFYYALLSFNIYILNLLIKNEKVEKGLIIICTILIFSFSIFNQIFYKDFNSFNKLRKENIIKQHNEGKKIITCPLYDNKYNYIFYKHLAGYEGVYCDKKHIEYITKDEDLKEIKTKIIKLR